ncbi:MULTISPECIES: 2Fe-2S iron-sulfur cluster-binding protein [unclassified Adlercreutzia]|uniref:2Fe-2S iron-sulfur cluster-binding protein n=1 Tax=unclassified Adlercreutzia TaxID=2636013 RepID=UPI0013EDE44D|nr:MULTISPECIES: 2Fe-2S iron-sulfur cluster-binding protein [unclassified Adlercreutzia]
MSTVSLVVDGRRIEAEHGENLLGVLLRSGSYVPHLCFASADLPVRAACRLCTVGVEGRDEPVFACEAKAEAGMVVDTRDVQALAWARASFDLVMATHQVRCGSCARFREQGTCDLREIAHHLGAPLRSSWGSCAAPRPGGNSGAAPRGREAVLCDAAGPMRVDAQACVRCGRCVDACSSAGAGILCFLGRGSAYRVACIGDGGDASASARACTACRACVDVCPAGALELARV